MEFHYGSTLSTIDEVAASAAGAHDAIAQRLSDSADNGAMHYDLSSPDLQRAAAGLAAGIVRAASIKTAALEEEAVSLEAALERAPGDLSGARPTTGWQSAWWQSRVAPGQAAAACRLQQAMLV